jgi:hypothetical protein
MSLHRMSEREAAGKATGAFDVRNWKVLTAADGSEIGKVRDVLVDEGGAPRLLEVDLRGFNSKRVLIPLERVSTDASSDVVWVAAMTRDRFEHIPEYDGDAGAVNADYEASLRRQYSAVETTDGTPAARARDG